MYIYILYKNTSIFKRTMCSIMLGNNKNKTDIFSASYGLTLSQLYMNYIPLMMMIRKL